MLWFVCRCLRWLCWIPSRFCVEFGLGVCFCSVFEQRCCECLESVLSQDGILGRNLEWVAADTDCVIPVVELVNLAGDDRAIWCSQQHGIAPH